ncbi:beta-lactamase family protein [Methylobacterium sp. E-005]|uniref:serine hydrolase domain-containing protein n=1 Tax=Methylobacterium sp. E-005 TaxID=2836549 RepID=UPI001FB92357|nr:serine hydrolase [Methylobacterium sp. E-005]MCJ2089424.1 beta-lactamase family protein [Methylobacterium sp. E-005]
MQGLAAEIRAEDITAFLILQGGLLVADWGDSARKVNVASVRKSLLSALYGIPVAAGRIRLTSTLAELGIDDLPPGLTPLEQRATVRDLLMARSGIYHPAASETADMRRKRPPRGSHAPGSFWYYNNWDFNALGTIYRQATGEDIFESFARRIAGPIGMEDFSSVDGHYVTEAASQHPAYRFDLSARDLARFGQLVLEGGRWQGRPLIPADWLRESTRPYSRTDHDDLGYGYLWWTLDADRFGPDAVMASGYGGQKLAILPAKQLVVVQLIEKRDGPHRDRTKIFLDRLARILAAAP